MSKKVALPLMLLSLGVFAVVQTSGCGSSSNGGGTGGKADGGGADVHGTGGAVTGTGGRVDAGAGTGGMVAGTGGRVDSGTDTGTDTGPAGTGGRIDSGTDVAGTGGMGTGGSDAAVDAPADVPVDAPATDVPVDTGTPVDTRPDTGPVATFDGAADASGQTRAAVLCTGGYAPSRGTMTPEDFCSIFVALCSGTVDAGDCIARYTASRFEAVNAGQFATYGNIGTCESVHVCNVYNIDGGAGTHCPHAAGTQLCTP